jgi:hypothetical protein
MVEYEVVLTLNKNRVGRPTQRPPLLRAVVRDALCLVVARTSLPLEEAFHLNLGRTLRTVGVSELGSGCRLFLKFCEEAGGMGLLTGPFT